MDEPLQPLPDVPPGHDNLDSVELEEVLAHRAPRRQRLARGALVLAALVIALGAPLRNALPLPHWSLAAAATPTSGARSSQLIIRAQVGSGATWTPGPVNIYSNVSYGSVTLNGQRLHDSPPLSVAALQPGPNILTLDAAPFPQVTCTVNAIGASSGAGSAYQASAPCEIQGESDGISIFITLTGENLPPTAAARALDTLRIAVSQLPTESTTVPAGEYYATGIDATGAITYARATEPLLAGLVYTANTAHATTGGRPRTASFTFGPPCEELNCPGYAFPAPAGVSAWMVSEPVLLNMRFQTPDGRDQGVVTLAGAEPQQFALAYRADGTWQTVNFGPTVAATPVLSNECATGANLLIAQVQAVYGSIPAFGFGGGKSTLEGCAITTTMAASGGSASVFIWRFGVLLAADASAHALLPALPLAPPSAIQAMAAP
jgi:hypothetical protein